VKPHLEIALPEDEHRLRTELCGIPLENPFLLSSSVVASTYDMCARAFEAGWAGAAFKTICSFPIHEASPRFSAITGDNGSIIGFKNIEQLSDHSVAENMEIFCRLKENYPSKFILASIMGQNEAEWEELARLCEENGADAIELNFSCPNMADGGLGSDIGQVPELVERRRRWHCRHQHDQEHYRSQSPYLCLLACSTREICCGRVQRQRRQTHCPSFYRGIGTEQGAAGAASERDGRR